MAIRARDFDSILSKWLQTREGKEAVYQAANVSPYTEAQMRAMAQELSDMIVDAYLSVVRHSGNTSTGAPSMSAYPGRGGTAPPGCG